MSAPQPRRPNARYPLRRTQNQNQNQPNHIIHRGLVNPRRTVTPEQKLRTTTANRISKRWPITRPSKKSRGLENTADNCYRNAALQNLVHIQKFMNVLLEHNITQSDGTTSNPCVPQMTDPCMACLMKAFIQEYWGKNHLDAQGQPIRLLETNPAVRPIHTQAYRSLGGGQQDSDEMLAWVLGRVETALTPVASTGSTAPQNPTNPVPLEQFKALFSITKRETRTCPRCSHIANVRDIDSLGLRPVPFPASGHCTVETAVHSALDPSDFPIPSVCSNCNANVTCQVTTTILAAPEYLIVSLALGSMTATGVFFKNFNRIQISDPLDLTNRQVDPTSELEYKPVGILAHAGNQVRSGHWAAVVDSYGKGVSQCNDSLVDVVGKDSITDNPHVFNVFNIPTGSQGVSIPAPMEMATVVYQKLPRRRL